MINLKCKTVVLCTFLFSLQFTYANDILSNTVEELRIDRAKLAIPNVINKLDKTVNQFSKQLTLLDLSEIKVEQKLFVLIDQFGQKLWSDAKNIFVNNKDFDDRSLYWARLKMTSTLRQSKLFQSLSSKSQIELLWNFELASRGYSDIKFDRNTDKKILALGFDPFLLDRNIEQNNPSGVTILALDNEVVQYQGSSVEIETVVIPVRFADFDQGIIEQLLTSYMKNDTVDMVITISMGRKEFDLEHFPGLRRSSTAPDNLNIVTGANEQNPLLPNLYGQPLDGPEFIEFSLPVTAMQRAKGKYKIFDNKNIMVAVQTLKSSDKLVTEQAGKQSHYINIVTNVSVQGSGGGYLSNEISYRSLRLRDLYNPNLAVGHIHTPRVSSFVVEQQKSIVEQIKLMIAHSIASI